MLKEELIKEIKPLKEKLIKGEELTEKEEEKLKTLEFTLAEIEAME